MALQSEYNGLDTGYNLGTLAEHSKGSPFRHPCFVNQDLAVTSGSLSF